MCPSKGSRLFHHHQHLLHINFFFIISLLSLLLFSPAGNVQAKVVEGELVTDKVSRAQHDCRVTRTVTPVVNTGGRIYLHRPPGIIAASGPSAATPPPQIRGRPRPRNSSSGLLVTTGFTWFRWTIFSLPFLSASFTFGHFISITLYGPFHLTFSFFDFPVPCS
ncbi:hypothetical protein TYRP_020646 [Tyrophagus putrescentiae]|nr:hypothetical protein TYRP_020646 [Tyrophagus putrescentiae]